MHTLQDVIPIKGARNAYGKVLLDKLKSGYTLLKRFDGG